MPTPEIVPADVAFMLVATALVLLMTPALAFFYGGLVRSKNALNTMMMSVAALGFVGVAWALLGYSLAFAAGGALIGDFSHAFLNGVGARAAGHDPAAALHVLPGHLRDHHRRAHLGRDRRAHALRAVPAVHHALEPRGLRARSPLGVGRRLPRQARRARLRRRHRRPRQRRDRRARGGARARPAQGLRTPGDPAPQRAVRPARRRPALVRLVRLQRRQRARGQRDREPGVHQHDARARGARSWSGPCSTCSGTARRPRSAPPPRSWSAWWRSRPPPASWVRSGAWRSARSPRCRATSRSSTGRAPASTTRSTWWPRTASAARWAPCSPASSPSRPGTASPTV